MICKLATGVGIAPTPPAFQTGVQTDYTIQWKYSSRAVLLRGLPVIGRGLCF